MGIDRRFDPHGTPSRRFRLPMLVAVALLATLLATVGSGAGVAQTASFTFSGTVTAPSGSSVDSVMVSVVSHCWTETCVGEVLPDDESQRPLIAFGPWQLLGETQVDSSGNWSVSIQPSWDDTYPQLVFWDRAGKLESIFYPVLIAHSGGGWSSTFGEHVSEISDIGVNLNVGGRVSGRFSLPGGVSLPKGDYVLTTNSRSAYYYDFALDVDPQTGEFTSPLVAPRQYNIAYGNLGGDYLNHNAATSVEVTSGQITNAGTIEIHRAAKLSGRITNSSGQGLGGITISGQVGSQNSYYSMPRSPFNGNGSTSFWATTNDDGTYAVRSIYGENLVPGSDWELTLEDNSGNYVARHPKGTAITAGQDHSCAIAPDGTIDCWGSNDWGQTDAPEGQFTAIATGHLHSCAINTDGTVECWGKSDLDQTDAPGGTFTAVTAGNDFSCGLKSDQTVACWGYDAERHNQNPNAPIAPPETPSGQFTAISAGDAHSCGIRPDGTVACWGSNRIGQREGIPSGRFNAISAGYYHTCAIRADGTVACWGGPHRSFSGESELTAPGGQFIAIAAGFYYTCAIRTDGTVACWGSIVGDGQADPPDGQFIALAAYVSHTCGIRANQVIECWGKNDFGQGNPGRGLNSTTLSVPSGVTATVNYQMASASSPSEDIATPIEVVYTENPLPEIEPEDDDNTVTFSGSVTAPSGSSVERVVVSVVSDCWSATCPGTALPEDEPERLRLIGTGQMRLLDESQVESSGTWSVTVDEPDWDRLYLLFWDRNAVLATADFRWRAWDPQSDIEITLTPGGRVSGRFMNPTGGPLPSGAYALTLSGGSIYALDVDLETGAFTSPVVAPGEYSVAYGNLGGDYLNHNAATTVDVAAAQATDAGTIELQKAAQITGTVTNSLGQGLGGITVSGQISSQSTHWSMPRSPFNRNGSTSFWATTADDGTYAAQSLYPGEDWEIEFEIPDPNEHTAISAGGSHNCAIKADGTISCWGNNEHGQTNPPDGQYTAISAGGSHNCAIATDGTISCWGGDQWFGLWASLNSPDGQFTAISAGGQHTCAIATDGTISCWGYNDYGQTNSPRGQFTAISAGARHSCAIATNNTFNCWGFDSDGQATEPHFTAQEISQEMSIASGATVVCAVVWNADASGAEGDCSDNQVQDDADDQTEPEEDDTSDTEPEGDATDDQTEPEEDDPDDQTEPEEDDPDDQTEPEEEDTTDEDTGDDQTEPEEDAATRCFAKHEFGAQPVDVAKSADKTTVLAQLSWGFHESIGCFLTIDEAALATLQAAPAPLGFPSGNAQIAQQCFAKHEFGAQPVDVAKSADKTTVLAQVRWGFHESIGCFLTLDDASIAALRAANT